MRRRFPVGFSLTLALVLAVGAPSGPARAAPAPRPAAKPWAKTSAADKKQAKELFGKGKVRFSEQRYESAISLFKRAYALWPHPVILYNLSVAYAMDGQTLVAGTHTRKYLAVTGGKKAKLVPVLQKALNETGRLRVSIPNEKADIFVDGRKVGVGRIDIDVLAGARAVDIELAGQLIRRKVVEVPPDGTAEWKAPKWIPPRPSERRPPPSQVTPKTIYVRAPARPRGKPLGRLPLGAFIGVAATALAAAGGATGLSVVIRNLHDKCTRARCSGSEMDRGDTLQLVTNVLWGVAGAAAVTAGVLAIFTRWRKKEQAADPQPNPVSVQPTLGPHGAGVMVRWRH